MKNHFFMPYYGNKRLEVDNIHASISDIEQYDTIVEPFCGSAAFSYYISTIFPKKFKFVLNDNNKYIIELFHLARDRVKLTAFSEKLNAEMKAMTRERYKEINREKTLMAYIIVNKIYYIRPGMYPIEYVYKPYDIESVPFVNFLQNEDVSISCKNGIDILESYQNDAKSLIFLDPPYLNSCNKMYLTPTTNVYEYLYNNSIQSMSAYIVLCLEDIWIIRLLFQTSIKTGQSTSYNKTYQNSKKKTKHIIITSSCSPVEN